MGTMITKPNGFFQTLLAFDCETSGLAYNSDDPSYDKDTGKTYQAISWGFIVADAVTLLPIEKLYIELKFNDENEWAMEAQNIHGLSRDYLNEHGMEEEEAVVKIASFVMKHFGPTSCIHPLGHNVQFDIWFLKRLMRKFDINLKFGNRVIDTNSLGFATFETFTSNQLFEAAGLPERKKHNSLEDIEMTLESARRIKMIFNAGLEA